MRRARIACAATAAIAAAIASPGVSAWGFTSADDYSKHRFQADSADVDNPYLPLTPGMRYTFDGVVKEGKDTHRHRVIFTITDLTKVVNGVRTRVLWDQDLNDGVLEEEEITFHAQDRDGSVWNFGEYPEIHEDGEFKGAPDSWLAGVRKSRAGVIMQAHPATGTPWYSQGLAPSVEFDDQGKVVRTGQRVKGRHGKVYDDVVVVNETSASQPGDGHQLKYHAPGIGVVKIEARGGDAQEDLHLTKIERLDAAGMAHARRHSMAMDTRAHRVVPKVWAGSAPLARPAVAIGGRGGDGGSGANPGAGGAGGSAAVCAATCER